VRPVASSNKIRLIILIAIQNVNKNQCKGNIRLILAMMNCFTSKEIPLGYATANTAPETAQNKGTGYAPLL
jgi:hypothetical protein